MEGFSVIKGDHVKKLSREWEIVAIMLVGLVALYVLFPVSVRGQVFMVKEYNLFGNTGYLVGVRSDTGGVTLEEVNHFTYKQAKVGKDITIWRSRW